MRRVPLIVAVRSSATYIIVSLYVLVLGPIGMLLALVFRWPGILYILGHGGVRLGFALAGITYSVVGREHLRHDRAVVFCPNHQSNLDPPVLFEALHPRLHVLYKAELGRLPILGRVFRIGGFIPVERGHDRAREAIEAASVSLREGHSFLVFPEGTRSRTDSLLPFKKGGFVMAIKGSAPVVPVAIRGGREAMKKGSLMIRPARVVVRIGVPMETVGLTLDDRAALAEAVRSDIQRMRDEIGPIG